MGDAADPARVPRESARDEIIGFEEEEQRTFNDPRQRRRQAPMEVIVLGMPRTGTFSLRAALLALGYKGVYHMSSVFRNPRDCEMWGQALDYKLKGKGRPLTREEWDALLGESQACLDAPPAMFIPELLEAYPEAKLIISERPVARWWDSMQRTINRHALRLSDYLLLLDPELYGPTWALFKHMPALFGDVRNEALATAAYRRYHAEARGLVPEGLRRLEFQLSDGWGPLCKFLGKEVPAGVPFPHLNEGADFDKGELYFKECAFRRVRARALRFLLKSSVLAVIALGPWVFLPKETFVRFGNYLTWKR